MKATFLSRFTPSMMSHEALEAVFVQRQALARRLVELIRDSVLTPNKHHTLLIGARGLGKTHLVSLIYYRVRALQKIRSRVLIAWLREEEWGVTSFLDLLLRIFRALLHQHPDRDFAQRVEKLYQMSPQTATRAAAALLREFVGNRTVLLLVENLDDLFQGLKDEGQREFRSYLQENPFCTILATSQSLFNGVSRQTSPFYGFFRPQHLEELTLDEAAEMLTNIATYEGDQELVEFIASHTGRARLRAVQHLAGGNHRVYVIFSQFLTRESLDDLVEPLMRTLDDLTPYYQARIQWLSLQQRKIVEFLCDRRGAAPVREIAQRCFLTHQVTSSQLKTLREMGYVHSISLGRESYYELREPLMRLSIEVKKHRAEPIRLLIDFLRIWYSRPEMEQRLAFLPQKLTIEREYLRHAIRISEKEEDPKIAACERDFNRHFEAEQFEEALEITEELVAIGDPFAWFKHSWCLLRLARYRDALVSLDKMPRPLSHEIKADFLLLKGWLHLRLNSAKEALTSFEELIKLRPRLRMKTAWKFRSYALRDLKRYKEELTALNKSLELFPKDSDLWERKGDLLLQFEKPEEALQSYKRAARLSSDSINVLYSQAMILHFLDRHQEALRIIDKALKISPDPKSTMISQACRIGILIGSDQWGKAEIACVEIGDARLSSETMGSLAAFALLSYLVIVFQREKYWRPRAEKIFEIYQGKNRLSALASALTGVYLPEVVIKISDLTKWRDMWREIAGQEPEFQQTFRLLDTWIQYRETGSEQILLDLPVEERRLMQEMLKSGKKFMESESE